MTTTEATLPGAEQQIRQALEAYFAAIRRKDLDAIMSCYTADVVAFDVPPPLAWKGRDAYRKSWETGLSMMKGDIEYETRDLRVQVSGDLAWCHAFSRMAMDMGDGQRMDSWLRVTWGMKRSGDRWLIAHEHGSFPIDMETNAPRTDLKP